MEELEINVALQISKPIHEVFDAILDPKKMSNYFIAQGSEKMAEGKSITWTFPEFPDMLVPVEIIKVNTPNSLIFEWEGSKDRILKVNIYLEKVSESSTLVKVTEGKMKVGEEGINWLKRNTEGWANFLACMKAYLEYGINLRKGGFDYMQSNKA